MEPNTEIEAAGFRRLLEHLDSRKDLQNIDLINWPADDTTWV
jgi:hypothetical protein